ncbi:hypothetical protein CC2G_004624 [Coprinopsis cinerea AmutBmut pab1-1]|nr:hypothetical protein CC2G_004624 [Coprinopsis cinerea AmutBmut pab1-1]
MISGSRLSPLASTGFLYPSSQGDKMYRPLPPGNNASPMGRRTPCILVLFLTKQPPKLPIWPPLHLDCDLWAAFTHAQCILGALQNLDVPNFLPSTGVLA